MIAVLQMRELRHRAIKTFARGPAARKENHQDSKAESSSRICASMTPEVILSHHSPNYILTLQLKLIKMCSTTNLKRYMHPSVHSSIIYNCQGMEMT